MANERHLAILWEGVEEWNGWRRQHPDELPDLYWADLVGAKLGEADLRKADLSEANLIGADLRNTQLAGAILFRTDLRGAELNRADLSEANLFGANLIGATLIMANLRGALLSKADLRETSLVGSDLADADLREAKLAAASLDGAQLTGANLVGMDLREAKLAGASLDGAQLTGANLAGLNLNATNAVGANLSDVDLRQANLIDARLDGANLTGAKLWETQRTGWSIKGVVCRWVFWDREGEEPTEYAEGEFERLFAEKPLVRLHYPGGVSPADLLVLPLILRQLEKEHPDSALRIRSMQDDAGGVTVAITLDDLTGRGGEEVAQVQAVLQAKLRCVEAERDRLASDLVPRLLDLVAASRQMNIIGEITGRVALGGGTMIGDTYNVHGQAGAVGPNAHVHDNTFQQVQGATLDLPRLAEELGRLHNALKGETTGTREQDKAIVAMADAEEAAAKGDGPGALGHLKSAGRWALGVAEKIGVSVAAKAIEKAMLGQ